MQVKKASKATVSVAMAVYNGQKFLQPQLDSVLCQLNPWDELVISYDQSTDSTLEIINDYATRDGRIKVIFDPGAGVTSNFENAIAHCKNEVIFICDQDDLWALNKIQTCLTHFVSSENSPLLVIHNGCEIDACGVRIGREDFFTHYGAGPGLFKNFIKSRYSGCCMAFNRASLELILPIPRSVECYDRWIACVMEARARVVFEPALLIEHRLHGGNVTPARRPIGQILRNRLALLKALLGGKVAR